MDRIVRVNELLKRELGGLIERDVSREFACLVTVTGVSVTPDLRQARVLLSFFGGTPAGQADALTYVRRRRADFQAEVARNIKLKYTPVLEFVADDTIARADELVQLLDTIEVPDEPPEEPPDAEAPDAT